MAAGSRQQIRYVPEPDGIVSYVIASAKYYRVSPMQKNRDLKYNYNNFKIFGL